jgi:hypothetical protein
LTTIRNRFYPLPIDNFIPALFANRLAQEVNVGYIVGDWQSSDRPPLQSGFILFLWSLLDTDFNNLFWGESPTYLLSAIAAGVGVVAQLLWIPAIYSLLKSIGFSEKSSILTILFCAVTPVVFVNTLYSWPKLLSAAFVVSAITILLEDRKSVV